MAIELKEVLTLYESCVKTCNLCNINARCNSCKKKTEAQMSHIVGYHYGASISDITFASPSTSHSGEKTNKCNQCDFASSYAGALRTHLKTHSGEKSNKCNQCDYTSSQTSNLRTHFKMHSGKSQTNATNVTMPLLIQAI